MPFFEVFGADEGDAGGEVLVDLFGMGGTGVSLRGVWGEGGGFRGGEPLLIPRGWG